MTIWHMQVKYAKAQQVILQKH
uniref:Uncharacterized protein n=1 Tax=Arundo donax TaxID=35708 RepID=A0A0A9DFQ6_ARUDO